MLDQEKIERAKEFLDKLLHDVYAAGENQRYMFELSDYHTFEEAFEAFCETFGLEV